ncbi:chloride channel protein, partial [Streptomyces sp. SID5998]|nr:chloride channel protein [Streptomyces sp. SID5998]
MGAIPVTADGERGAGHGTTGSLGRAPRLAGVRDAAWGVMALAVVVGAGAGAGSIVFRWCIQTFTRLLSGHADYSASPGA